MYYLDKFHIQWCLYTLMDLWNTINDYDYYDYDSFPILATLHHPAQRLKLAKLRKNDGMYHCYSNCHGKS